MEVTDYKSKTMKHRANGLGDRKAFKERDPGETRCQARFILID
jgi:hypothetical protein